MTTLPGWTSVALQLFLITLLSTYSVFACPCQRYQGKDCASCNTGCYLLNRRCYRCPANCVSCADWNYCDSCTEGYFGTSCQNLCSGCRGNTCNKDDGQCTDGCVDGYYPNTDWAGCSKCYTQCRTCTSWRDCTACEHGFYGTSCSLVCSNCKYNICYKASGQCTSGCVDRYYQRQTHCARCRNQCFRCNSDTQCTVCNSGYHGLLCGSECDPNCKYGACDLNSGVCTNDCVDGYYQSGASCLPNCQINYCQTCSPDHQACSLCQDGYYLSNGICFQCRSECLNGKCDKTDGSCSEGCKDGLTSRYCNDQCYPNCNDCEQYNKETCTSCKHGYTGQICEYACSTQCKEERGVRQCAKISGECTQGCENGYSGSTCSDKCSLNCLSCDQTDQQSCETCNPGYYGQACDQECSSHCAMVNNTRPCHKDAGECLINCTKGYKGPKCDVPCEAGCKDGCDRDTGTCDRCKTIHYGPACEYTCNSSCYNPNNGSSVCDKQTGKCSFECSASQCGVQSGQESASKSDNNEAIIGAATGSVIVVLIVVVLVIVFIMMKLKRQKTSNPGSDGMEGGNTDNMYSMLDHAYQDKMTDYTALNALAGQLQEGQAISSPPTDTQKATYVNTDVNTDDISTGPAKDSYENVIGLRK